MKREWILAGGCALLVALLSPHIHPNQYREGRSRDPRARVDVNQSSLARILGEFRTGMSDMLFIKTERYLHSGVGYVPHLTEDLLTVQGTDENMDEHLEEMEEGDGDHHGHEEDHFHHEEDVETLLPTAEQDYRGWIGRMQREVKPWRDPSLSHKHTDGKELIPWFRMMTVSDPKYVRGYVVGAFWLKRYDIDAALAFIEEGLVENPEAFQLHLSKGMLLMSKARSLAGKEALTNLDGDQRELLLQARAAFRTSAEFMMLQRPALPAEGDITDLPDWGVYLESDAMAAANLAVLFERRYGDAEAADTMQEQLEPLFPDAAGMFGD